MKATETKLLDFLKRSPQFIIPIYQRAYSWQEPECRQLWNDIMRTGREDAVSAHFIGSIVYIEDSLYSISGHTQLLVIDGQQRVTTVLLIIEALARRLGEDEPLDGFSETKLRNRCLKDPDESGQRGYKLLLTETDRETLLALMDNRKLPDNYSLRLKENFDFFQRKVKELGGDFKPLCAGLSKLVAVDISLDRQHDNPQLIFESMNSTGRALSQADLIRNFILMGLKPDHQERIYIQYWRQMEENFGQKAYSQHFDGFMRHYLTVKIGEIPRVGDVYEEFKKYARPKINADDIDSLVADVHAFAGHYCAMALGKETDRGLAAAFSDLRVLKADIAYPFLLELYHDYANNRLDKEDLERSVRLVESYVFRRAVCAIPTNSMNKTFAAFGKALNKEKYLESILAHFLLLPTYRRFPRDDEFKHEIKARDLYNFRSLSYWLHRLENHGRKEQVSVNEYSTEHIMPQKLTEDWRAMLGDDWQKVHNDFLHTLGNLTLTRYNSEFSNRPFAEKRDMKGGFKNSPLNLNEGLGKLEAWDEAAIQSRANQLAEKAVDVWKAPNLPEASLDIYRPDTEPAQMQLPYTINDYKYLTEEGPARELFDYLRKEVRALDPGVMEEFFKTVIAYKAETNFVSVVPQARGLKLILNLSFHELQDPEKMARDVAEIGSLGTGDVEVHLRDLTELPYIMGLVRQAFEKQMGNEDVGA
ncbi:MAG: DUF262 and DUF1524 domain-containing protein [Gammaproteobacteria bacterium]|nr:DUF262 and DUF1524 domain-containing protein [Gammaproteobacteria bacterium]